MGLIPGGGIVFILAAVMLMPLLFVGDFHALWADRIVLRDGGVLQGRVVGQTRHAIRLRTRRRVRVIPKSSIREIVYEKTKRGRKQRAKNRRANNTRVSRKQAKPGPVSKSVAEPAPRSTALERARTNPPLMEPAAAKGALWRSALMPGWGQVYGNRKAEGLLFTGSFLLGALAARRFSGEYRKAAAAYGTASTNFLIFSPMGQTLLGRTAPPSQDLLAYAVTSGALSSARTNRSRAGLRARASMALLLGVYAWNLRDAYFGFAGDAKRVISITAGDGLRVSFRIIL